MRSGLERLLRSVRQDAQRYHLKSSPSVDTPLSPDLQGPMREPTCSKPNQPSCSEGSHGVAKRARAIRHEGANLLEEH